ncbi:MAG: FtsX-like permease family protein, partial [Longimicrobiales bacterium]
LLQLGAAAVVRTGAADEPPAGVPLFANAVTEGYLEMLDVPLLRGRSIQAADGPDAEPVALVNRAVVERFFPGREALDQTVEFERRSPDGGARPAMRVRIVGITADAPYLDFDDAPAPYLWTSLAQDPAVTVVVTVEGADPERLAVELRAFLPPADGGVPVLPAATYASQLSLQSLHLRVMARVLGWGGGLGLFLALIGVYGLVSFVVAQRTRELAIRRAVGAGQGRVVARVLRRGMALAGGGVAAGVAVLLPVAPLLRGLLVDVAPLDPVSLGGAAALLVCVAALASWLPARRAARTDPMRILGRE